MLMPSRVKRRKVQRGRMKGVATRGNKLTYGEYGLVALEPHWISSNQIEAARITISKFTKKGGKVWIDIFPDKPVSKQPIGKRMGSGKGDVEFWAAVVKPGRVLFEVKGISEADAKEALRQASHKLPIKTKFVKREDFATETVTKGGAEE